MIFQDPQWTRFLVGLIPVPFTAVLFFFLAYKVFRRKKSRSSLSLMGFYIIIALGLIMNTTYLFITIYIQGILLYILYSITAFVIIFPFVFILLFLITLLKSNEEFNNRRYWTIIIIYGVVMVLLYALPGGVTLSETGTPLYSLSLMFLIYCSFSAYITVPVMIYSRRLFNMFKDPQLKKKLRLFVWGVSGMLITVYGAVLFNTSSDILYKSLWGVIAFAILIPSAILVYNGLGKSL